MKYLFPVLAMALLSLGVQAEDTGKVLDVKFPDAETGVIFQLSQEKPQLTLLSFWQVDCEPCLKDMALLSGFVSQHKDVRVMGISISDKQSTRAVWQKHAWQPQSMPFPTLVNNGFPGELLKHFGNTVGAVPYTVMLSPDRQLCWTLIGQITEEQLQQGLAACRIRT